MAEEGVGVPDDLSILSFDDFDFAPHLKCPLTVVRQDVATIGRTVAERLFARIGGDDSPPQHVVLEPTLVERGSGELPPPD